MKVYNTDKMVQILLPLVYCVASVIAGAQVPSHRLLGAQNAGEVSNLTAVVQPSHHFLPHYFPPINTMPQILVPRPHIFQPSLQTPAIAGTKVFPAVFTPNQNASLGSELMPINTMHFIPNHQAAMTISNSMVPVVAAPGVPSKPMMPSDRKGDTKKISEMTAEDLIQLTQPKETSEKTTMKDISEEARYQTGSRPGVCPFRQCTVQHLAQQIRRCSSDLNCLPGEKCCSDPCWGGLSCAAVAPQPNALVCPPQAPCTDRTFKVVCGSDNECYAAVGSKCCMDQCLGMFVCKHPVLGPTPPNPPSPWQPPTVGPPSHWQPPIINPPSWQPPIFPPIPPIQPPIAPEKCKRYCPGSTECCDSVFHIGYCPAMSLCYSASQIATHANDFKSCAVDQQCKTSEKCCLSRCHNRLACLPSVKNPEEHPGSCPAASVGCDAQKERTLARCTNDRQCYLFQRCCSSSCFTGQSLCMDTGASSSANTSSPDSQCTTLCPGSNLCCDDETKPGYCPKTKLCSGTSVPTPVCASDQNCNGDQKCCPNSCTDLNECMASVNNTNDHAGFCPVPNCIGAVPPVGKLGQCRLDTDCYMHQKCCPDCSKNYNCETSLTAPVSECGVMCPDGMTCCDGREKPGHCPATAECSAGQSGAYMMCTEDYGCPGASKCCYDECRKRKICQPPASTAGSHPGDCPATPCDAAGPKFICHQDSECYFHERCCPSARGGGKVCQATNCTNPFMAYGSPGSNTVTPYQPRPSPPYFPTSPIYPLPLHPGYISSNKNLSLSAPAPHGLPTDGSGSGFYPLSSLGVPPQNLPSLHRQPSSGSANYPAASQPLSNRYTWPNYQGYRPQIPYPQNPLPQNPLPQNPLPQNPLHQNPLHQNSLSQNPFYQNPLPQNTFPQNPLPQNPLPHNPLSQSPLSQNPLPQNSFPHNSLLQNTLLNNPHLQSRLPQNSLTQYSLPQNLLPQTSDSVRQSPGRYVSPHTKERPKYYRPPQPFYSNSKFE